MGTPIKDKAYFERQIKGLILILDQDDCNTNMIAKKYVKEKLNMILVCGIGFHQSIKNKLDEEK